MTNRDFTSDYRYLFIDSAGREVIDASKYQSVGSFAGGLAAVLLEDKGWGFIEKTGKVAIEPQFQAVLHFSEGLAGVEKEGKWGFIDKAGQTIIDPVYRSVNGFSDGVAVVVRDDQVLVIDKTGQITLSRGMNDPIQLRFYENARFSEGLIDVYDRAKEKYGFADKTGKLVIEPIYVQVSPFTEGLARVSVLKDGEEKVGFINHTGQLVISPKFNTDGDFQHNSTDFSEGLASLTENLSPTVTEEEKFVYIDKNGAIALFTDFSYAGPFRDGLASVYSADTGKSGFIDRAGRVVIPIEYDFTRSFSEGLACVAVMSR